FAAGRNGSIQLAGCWSHVRRKFFDAMEQTPRTAGWVMRQIQNLYQIEAGLRQKSAGAKVRAAVRQHESRPIVELIHRALIALKVSRRHLPQSLVGKAIGYALRLLPALMVYLEE